MSDALSIAVIGSGYVGLVSGACFADLGYRVTCVDNDAERVATLKRGHVPIYEPGLEELIARGAAAQKLFFTADLAQAVAAADVVLITVGTPPRSGDGFADLSNVYDVAREIAPHLDGFTVVVLKSTVPVGTGDEVERVIRGENPHADFAVASNPEFLREGAAIDDFNAPDRVVVGVDDLLARDVLSSLYAPLRERGVLVIFTERRASELIKYATNAFLALKLTFINEMADLCERVGVDVLEVARGVGTDTRIGTKFLNPGPGFGGSCFPKDALALVKTAQDAAAPLRLIETMLAINDVRRRAVARKVIEALPDGVRGRRIAVLGVTFKPDTDDIREAPSLSIIQALKDKGATVAAYDPKGMESGRAVLSRVDWAADPYECAKGASAIVLVTEWSEFRSLDFERVGSLMKERLVVDLRNLYRAEELADFGFRHVGIGRPQARPQERYAEAAE
jgi:UDPglucose 6-dehydrogenase